MKNKKYAIIDLETTGGMAKRDRITEIAIVLHDGEKVIDQYDTLINPERSIPPEITRITGITNDMVRDAPKFYEVAKKVVQMTEGAIFVAHNVRFDYSFIKEEFRTLGYPFNKRQLCTVKLSRKAFPGLKSYSLGNLIRHFEIETENRHRALDDTLATVDIFQRILKKVNSEGNIKEFINHGIKESRLPKGIKIDDLHALPEETGVYYFHNEAGDVIYIGKAINIKKRIFQHFANTKRKGDLINQQVRSISFELTGSELVALLKEANEIKATKPEMNKALRNTFFSYFLGLEGDVGAQRLVIKRYTRTQKRDIEIIKEYTSLKNAKWHAKELLYDHNICTHEIDVPRTEFVCENHGMCDLLNAENIQTLKEDVQRLFDRDMIIFDHGRDRSESAVIAIQDGKYIGYGYISKEDQSYGAEEILESILIQKYYPIYNGLIWNHIKENNVKIVYL